MKRIAGIAAGVLLALLAAFAAYVYAVNRPLPQTAHDAAIIERTIELLGDEAAWSRDDDRSCAPDEAALSLYCALRQASIEITGGFEHRAAALQEVRYAIENQKPDADYAHRLMDYNNDPSVGFDDLHRLLRRARDRLEEQRQAG